MPLILLIARIYLFCIFLITGLSEFINWGVLFFNFVIEYSFFSFSPEVIPLITTIVELVLPLFLLLGVASRFCACGLSIVNLIAVISLKKIILSSFVLHFILGILLSTIMFFGAGILSIEKTLKKRY